MSGQNDCMHGIDAILAAFSGHVTLLLQNIRRCYETSGRSFNKDINNYFRRVSNEILVSKFEMDLLMDAGRAANETSGVRQSNTSADNVVPSTSANSNTNSSESMKPPIFDLVKTEADCAISTNDNEKGTSPNVNKSAVICIDDSSDDESADIKPKVEKIDGDGELASMELQTNSDFDEYLNNSVEGNQEEQVTDDAGDLLNSMGQECNINNKDGSSERIASDKEDQRTTVSDGGTLLKSRPSSKNKKKGTKLHGKRSKVGSNKPNRTQAGKRLHQCEVCLKTFSCSSKLKIHRIVHVSRQYRFYCVGCARGFDQETEKEAHNKVCEERRYECHICKEYATVQKTNLKAHMRIHTGEKPFRCSRCSKEFKQSANLQHHQLVHVKRFKYRCVGCARGFKREADQMAHDKVCDKRRYECHICKEFAHSYKTHLKVHMRKHTGEKPYRCEICMEHFTQRGSLKTHLDNIHSKNTKQ